MQPRNCRNDVVFISAFFIFLVALALSGGCSKNDSTPVSSGPTYPSVSGNWVGVMVYTSVPHVHSLSANLTSNGGQISGTAIDTCSVNHSAERAYVVGTIAMIGAIALRETSLVALNFGQESAYAAGLRTYNAAISPNGDSISGSWRNSSGLGTMVLLKR